MFERVASSLPPALKALLAQIIGVLLAFAAGRSGLLPAGMGPLLAVQALTAAGVAVALRSARWWPWIHLGFAPLVAGALALAIAPGWYLAAFVVFALIYWSSFRTQVPLFLSSTEVAQALAQLIPREHPPCVLDVGSGTGSLLRPLAQLRPDCRCEGVEAAPAPYWLSRWLAREQPNVEVARGDFFKMSWSDYDVVYAFLSPVPMPAVWEKARQEMRPGTLLISNSFAVPDVDALQVLELNDRRHTRLYCYQPAGPAPKPLAKKGFGRR